MTTFDHKLADKYKRGEQKTCVTFAVSEMGRRLNEWGDTCAAPATPSQHGCCLYEEAPGRITTLHTELKDYLLVLV